MELQRKVKRHMDAIVATATHGLTNARVEAVNNKIKLIVKMAYGFKNLDSLFSRERVRVPSPPVVVCHVSRLRHAPPPSSTLHSV